MSGMSDHATLPTGHATRSTGLATFAKQQAKLFLYEVFRPFTFTPWQEIGHFVLKVVSRVSSPEATF